MKASHKLIVNRAVTGLFVSLVFFTPLLFSHLTSEAYEFPKMIFVYLAGTTLLFVWLLRRLLFKQKGFVRPDWDVLLYVGAITLSTVFSSHFYTSMWGYYSRFNGGLVSFLVFFGIYLVGINFMNEERAEAVRDFACLSIFPVSLYGIFQIFEYDRVFSTLGQPNWLAAYIVLLLPLLLNRVLNAEDSLKKYFWIGTLIISFISLWFTNSLSGLAGLVAAGVYLTIRFGKKVFSKWSLILLGLFLILGLLNFSYFLNRISDALVISTDPQSYNISDPGLIRLGLWRGSLNMAISRPKNFLLGVGPETFPYEFPFFRDDILNYSSEWDFILNKPHNYYLEILVESGVLALLFYGLIMFRTLKNKDVFLAAGLAGFYVTNIFSWPTVSTSLLFWMWLVFIRMDSLGRQGS